MIKESPKAISYYNFKFHIGLEKYLYTVDNIRHRIALSRFRLSNHNLLIETGRHQRPKLERYERKCFICENKIEDETHFLVECPLYFSERKLLYDTVLENSQQYISIESSIDKCTFLLINEDQNVMKKVAKYIFYSMQISVKHINDISNCFKTNVILNDLALTTATTPLHSLETNCI